MNNYITIHHSVADQALEWAKENCPHYITNYYHRGIDCEFDVFFYDFFFVPSATEEMLVFKLKWASVNVTT